MKYSFENLETMVLLWATDRDLIDEKNVFQQFAKFIEEAGELSKALLENDPDKAEDAFGDVLVTLIILHRQYFGNDGITGCLERAWDEIKHREGETKNGTFIRRRERGMDE